MDRQPWELTDYAPIVDEATFTWIDGKREGLNLEDFTSRAIATAAQRRLVEWLEGDCHAHWGKALVRWGCERCWAELKAALGVGNGTN